MNKKLYLAPMNCFTNYVFRSLILRHGADFVFTEMIRFDRIENEIESKKLISFEPERTIYQIAVSDVCDVKKSVNVILEKAGAILELNLNMGCPNSTMQKKRICGGILFDKDLMKKLAKELFAVCSEKKILPSVKLRMGTSIDKIEIYDYLKILRSQGIKKVYIHARTLRYPYEKPARFEFLSKLGHFSDMEIILNGDVDCYESFNSIVENYLCNGIMVGRAALYNPLVFNQIKEQKKTFKKSFDPVLNDVSLIKKGGYFFMSEEKFRFIIDFIDLGIKENLDVKFFKLNLMYLVKGLSRKKDIVRLIKHCNDLKVLRAGFIDFFDIKN